MKIPDITPAFHEGTAWNRFLFLGLFGHLLSGNQCREAIKVMANGIDFFLEKDEGPVKPEEVAFAFRLLLAYFTLFLERQNFLTPPAEPPHVKDDPLRCSFCGQSQFEVKKLIAGPKVNICNECVDICVEVISDDAAKEKEAAGEDLKKDDGKDPAEKGDPVEIPLP
jgi:hypothetical protein